MMLSEETFELIAQATTSIANIIIIIISIIFVKLLLKFDKNQFRKVLLILALGFLATFISVIAMTFYHFFELGDVIGLGELNEEISEAAETVWFIFMIISLLLISYSSYNTIKFFEMIKKKEESALRKLRKK